MSAATVFEHPSADLRDDGSAALFEHTRGEAGSSWLLSSAVRPPGLLQRTQDTPARERDLLHDGIGRSFDQACTTRGTSSAAATLTSSARESYLDVAGVPAVKVYVGALNLERPSWTFALARVSLRC